MSREFKRVRTSEKKLAKVQTTWCVYIIVFIIKQTEPIKPVFNHFLNLQDSLSDQELAPVEKKVNKLCNFEV